MFQALRWCWIMWWRNHHVKPWVLFLLLVKFELSIKSRVYKTHFCKLFSEYDVCLPAKSYQKEWWKLFSVPVLLHSVIYPSVSHISVCQQDCLWRFLIRLLGGDYGSQRWTVTQVYRYFLPRLQLWISSCSARRLSV